MRRSITSDTPRAAPRLGVTGAIAEPIDATRSFEAPRGGTRRKINLAPAPGSEASAADAPTRRGGPRPITQTSIKAITGDYAKADDNESANRPTARRITERLPSYEPIATSLERRSVNPRAELGSREAVVAAPVTRPTALRHAWMQGALTGALILTLAWIASLIVRGG